MKYAQGKPVPCHLLMITSISRSLSRRWCFHVEQAINAAYGGQNMLGKISLWEQTSSIFLKIADLIAGPIRAKLNAATMLGNPKKPCKQRLMQRVSSSIRALSMWNNRDLCSATPSFLGKWHRNRLEAATLEGFLCLPFDSIHFTANRRQSSYFRGEGAAMMGYHRLEASLHADLLCKCTYRRSSKSRCPQMAWQSWSISSPTLRRDLPITSDFAGIHFKRFHRRIPISWKTMVPIIHKYSLTQESSERHGGKDFVIAHKICRWQSCA